MKMENPIYNLTDQQKKMLEEFKGNLSDVLTPDYTDTTLIKWLRTRNFNLKAAERVFRENYNNKVFFGINNMLGTYKKPEVAEKYEPTGIIGFAKDGTLIRYLGLGRFDFYGFIMSMSCLDICLYISYVMESDVQAMKEESLRTGRNLDEMTYVADLEGFSIQQILHKNVLEMVLDYTRLLQDCYPEIWRVVLVVNAPAIFDKAFNMFKHVIRAPAFERMKLVNKDSTRDLLLQYIDEDVLPAFLGGKRVDSNGDPKCKEFINFGSPVPEKFYSQNRSVPILSLGDPGVMVFSVGPRSVRNVSMAIHQAGTKVKFEIRSESGSMNLAMFYKPFGEDPNNLKFPADNEYLEHDDNSEYEMVTVSLKAQIHCTPLDFIVDIPRIGIYVMRYSNVGSWFTPRKVLLRYSLIPPSIDSPN